MELLLLSGICSFYNIFLVSYITLMSVVKPKPAFLEQSPLKMLHSWKTAEETFSTEKLHIFRSVR